MMISVLTYFQIFALFFTAVLLFFFQGFASYKSVVGVLALFSYTLVVYYFLRHGKVRDSMVKVFFVLLLLTGLYCITPTFYFTENELYKSYRLVLFGQTIPVSLMAVVAAYDTDAIDKMKSLTPLISILFLMLSFHGAFFPTATAGGGLASTEYEMNYQSLGYMAAYASSFSLYFFLFFKNVKWHYIFKNRVSRWVAGIVYLLCFLVSIIAGGRGGFLLILLQSAFLFYVYFRGSENFFKIIPVVVILIFIGLSIFYFASTIGIDSSGYSRILGFVEGESEGRNSLWSLAIKKFLNSPIWGYGLGSVFYETGFYSHNMFTDLLVETGILGTSLFCVLLLSTVKKGIGFLKFDKSECIWLMLFLDGFVLGLFSSYYVAICPMIWSIVFIQVKLPSQKNKKKLCKYWLLLRYIREEGRLRALLQ